MEAEIEVGLTASEEESSAPLVRGSSKKKSVMNFGENGSNRTVKKESEINRDSVADSESILEENGALMSKPEKQDKLSMIMVRDVGVTEKKLGENAEERMGGEEFEAMPFDSQHSKAALETSVHFHFVEEEGSESTEILERGGASLDYESEKIEFVKSEKVIQATTEIKKKHSEKIEKGKNVCLDTHVFSDTGSTVTVRNGDHTINKEEEKEENGGFKQHQNGNSVSESARQNSHSSALNEQDERQLKERWTRILEKSEFEGKVEAIVKILKEQESHDLLCPVCSSCITKRVILRKRKRAQKEATDDVQDNVTEGEHDITAIQNDQAEISNEDSEDIEAYGCLACFSLFFRRVAGVKLFARKSDSAKSQSGSGSLSQQYPPEVPQESTQFIDREKESFHCLTFLYPWGQSNNEASSSRREKHFSTKMGSGKADLAIEDSSTLLQDPKKILENEKDTFPRLPFRNSWGQRIKKEYEQDKQLYEPLLRNAGDKTFDKVLPEALKDIFQNSGKKVLPSHAAVETVIAVKETSDPQSSNLATVASEPGNTGSQVQDSSVATEWDLLKSIVYGGLTVSITSLGVVSSAAGGDAKTLTVIVIGLANLVSGLFLLFNNILDLNYYHQEQFIETVGHSFWFNGFVAVFSFLVFGSLAPVTYGFSFQKSDDKLYKFLGASILSLVSIILLSLGKARVTKKSYIRVMILYIVTGFWASVIGFFAGKYIKKLLEKLGFVTD